MRRSILSTQVLSCASSNCCSVLDDKIQVENTRQQKGNEVSKSDWWSFSSPSSLSAPACASVPVCFPFIPPLILEAVSAHQLCTVAISFSKACKTFSPLLVLDPDRTVVPFLYSLRDWLQDLTCFLPEAWRDHRERHGHWAGPSSAPRVTQSSWHW